MKIMNIITFLVVSVLFSTVLAAQQQKFKQPSNDPKLWRNSFYVLLEDDASAKKTQKTIEKIIAKDILGMPLGTLKKHLPVSVSTLLPLTKGKKNNNIEEDARSKLGRYLIISYPDGVNLQEILKS